MLNIQNYTKRFGDKIAVDDLSLHIAAGEICAFIGHNGLRYKLKNLSSTSLR